MKGEGSGKTFGGGEGVLISVEREEGVGFQFQRRSDVKHVEATVSSGVGPGFGDAFGESENLSQVTINETKHALVEVLLQLGNHLFSL